MVSGRLRLRIQSRTTEFRGVASAPVAPVGLLLHTRQL
jgi:hypothetical protein